MLTSQQLVAINRFPDDNPNPVLRVGPEGQVTYANRASRTLLEGLGLTVGATLEPDLAEKLERAGSDGGSFEVVAGSRTWALWPVPIPDLGFTNVYAVDVTAERAIARFPDQNPNPVFRIGRDGSLVYANPASRQLVEGLGLELGARLPPDLLERIQATALAAQRAAIEVTAADRAFSLVPVDVPEFGFLNVYGTDVTAEKERHRLALENERLLLNILPEPVARRLRDGETMIADRFDDVTLMFADIVDFTGMSSSMTPPELVGVLNEVFTVFDQLVEEHGLEKVKTIGDAYMVVGGIPEWTEDHTARVARMALALADCVGRIEAARRMKVAFRIGIHCGPVVAGVIGTRKFIYDIWGDTVNVASRMESHGVPGRVQVSHAVRERLADSFRFEPRGLVDIKGKGPMPTWFLLPPASHEQPSVPEASAFIPR